MIISRSEWESQERALQEEILGVDPNPDAGRINEYRLLMRVLRRPLLDPPPENLSERIVSHVRQPEDPGDRFEMRLQGGLVALLVAGVIWAGLELAGLGIRLGTRGYGLAVVWSFLVLAGYVVYRMFEHRQWKSDLARWEQRLPP